MVGPRQRRSGMGRERSRCIIYFWRRRGQQIFEQTRPGLDLSRAPGGRRWLRIFCQTTVGDAVFRSELLRRV